MTVLYQIGLLNSFFHEIKIKLISDHNLIKSKLLFIFKSPPPLPENCSQDVPV